MTQLVLTDLEDNLRDRLRELARSHGRSMEEEAREILRQAVTANASPAQGLGTRIATRFEGIEPLNEEKIQELRGSLVTPPDLG